MDRCIYSFTYATTGKISVIAITVPNSKTFQYFTTNTVPITNILFDYNGIVSCNKTLILCYNRIMCQLV